MKKLISIVFIMLSTITVSHANAASGSNTGKIKTILWYDGHIGVLVKQEGMSDLGGCGRGDYYILDDQHLLL